MTKDFIKESSGFRKTRKNNINKKKCIVFNLSIDYPKQTDGKKKWLLGCKWLLWPMGTWRISGPRSRTLYEEKPGAYLNHLLKLLDGQKICRLDAKYERVLLKRIKVPIIQRNKGKDLLPYIFQKTGPWAERIFPFKFSYDKDSGANKGLFQPRSGGGA